jgi:proline dehydrogenase
MKVSPDIFDDTATAYAGKSDGDLQKAKALFQLMNNNALVSLGSSVATFALSLRLPVSKLFKWTVYNHFCGGETLEESKRTIHQLDERNVGVLLNYGVELKETEEDFDKTVDKNLEALAFGGENKAVKGLCIKLTGFGRVGLFEKIQARGKLSMPEKRELLRVKKRFDKICMAASANEVPLYVDAEESWIQNPLDELVEEMMAKYNRTQCIVFNTFQLYRHDKLAYLRGQIDKAKAGHYLLGAKIVRGAYMEKERDRAAEKNYPSPIHANKAAVDRDFDQAVTLCLQNPDNVFVCVASQSEESNLHTIRQMAQMNIEPASPRVIFSQLYGMGDNITFNLARHGFHATKYLPYGPVKDVIPYLIRRAQENTSVAGQTGSELALIRKEIKRRKNS